MVIDYLFVRLNGVGGRHSLRSRRSSGCLPLGRIHVPLLLACETDAIREIPETLGPFAPIMSIRGPKPVQLSRHYPQSQYST